MIRKIVANKNALIIILVLQFIPLAFLPPESYNMATQEWWLPVLLAVMTLFAVLRLFIRYDDSSWPWTLISFAQGFNIISRLMMFMPHASKIVDGVYVINTSYIVISALSMLLSAFMLWYIELPEIRPLLSRRFTS